MRRILFVLLLFVIASCSSDPRVGKVYYTKFALQYEKDRYYTTNYRKGVLLPVNTKVKLDGINRKVMALIIEDNSKPLKVINYQKHTGEMVNDVFEKMLSEEPVDIEKFSNLEKKNIKAGTLEKGMSKIAVLVAYGYPPQIETSSLDNDVWVYWLSRYNKVHIEFKNNKVVAIKD